MTMQQRYKTLFIMLFSASLVWLSPSPVTPSANPPPVEYAAGKVRLPVNPPRTLIVDVALTPHAQMQGMMFRKDWGDIQGMLFVFPDEEPRSFWMKNTYLPLDIIFLNREGAIVHIAANATPLDVTPIPSIHPAQMVLEVAAGDAAKYRLKKGDVLGIER